MKPTRALLLLITAGLTSLAAQAASPPTTRPNIIIFLADDMGFSDIGCYGGEIQTSHIDALAKDGIRFTQFYNTARCWPSRAAILTGYYAQQVRRDEIPGVNPTGARGIRPKWAHLLPDMLKPLGYHSYHSGKWHIDGQRLPAGFEHSYSIDDHDHHFFPTLTFEDDKKLPPVDPNAGYYSSVAVADYAIKFLKEHGDKHAGEPFFEYVAFITPHFPLMAPAEDIARYKGKYDAGWDEIRKARWERQRAMGWMTWELPDRDPDIIPNWNLNEAALKTRISPGEVGHAVAWDTLTSEQKQFQSAKMEVHAAMVDRMDKEIGRVLTQVDKMGATENTIILFLSDNGASAEQIIRGDGNDPTAAPGSAKTFLGIGPGWSTCCNTPLRLHKSWAHEGGISTPLVVRWPKGIAARGEFRSNPGHLIDLAPTLLELAGGTWPKAWGDQAVPTPPGKSLVPVFTTDNTVEHDYLWWFHVGNKAIRVGNWKLVTAGANAPWELYDLSKDRGEKYDLSAKDPDRVKQLAAVWQQHMDEFKALAIKDLPAGKQPKAKPELPD